jgi:hypothetical protein
MNNLEKILNEQIATEQGIVLLLAEAARTERFLSKPKPPGVPSMYDCLISSGADLYNKEDIGYYTQRMKLRATPKQITRWEFAVDVICMVDKSVSEDPLLDRELLWLRAKRYKWTELAKKLGFNRTSLRYRYTKLIEKLCAKVKKEITFDTLNKILYLI